MTVAALSNDPAYLGEAEIPRPQDFPVEGGRGVWPEMLVLEDEDHDRLVRWLEAEIFAARQEREPLLDDFEQWQTDYWAKPSKKVKNFPFKRAANIVVPLTATAVEAIHARLMNTMFAVEPFWSIRPKTKPWIEAAKPVERWLQTEAENPEALDVYNFCAQSFMELIKLGTGVGKSGYEKVIKKVNDDGIARYVTVRNSATLDYVPVANFLQRIHETDPQLSGWCGEEHTYTWAQLKRMAGSGRMIPNAVEQVRTYLTGRGGEGAGSEDYQEHVDELAKNEQVWHEEVTTQEIWCSFDVDGDGWDEELVVDYHYDSRTILSIRYNWYEDLHRPYRVGNFIPVEGRLYGIGVGKQNEQLQKEVTTIRRQRLDNATLANMRMIAIKKTSGYGPNEPIFPGKMWFLDDVEDIKALELSEIYQSSIVNENSVIRDSEKRTGVNEVLLGLPQEGTPGTATGDLARIAEGNKRYDLVLKNVRRWLGLLGQDVVANYQQFGDQERHWITTEDGEWVERVFTMPAQLVRFGANIDITVTDSTVNRQVEQRQWMGVFQMMSQHFGSAMEVALQLVQLTQDPQMLQFAVQLGQRSLLASDTAMQHVLSTFDNVVDKEPFKLLPQGDAGADNRGNAAQSLSGPTGGPGASQGQAGLESLVAALAATGRGNAVGNGGGRF